jgi:DNA repair protein RecO (recombination protein O)
MPRGRVFRARGLVLRRRDFGEADRLLTVLTEERGKLVLLAKGVRRLTSRKAAHLELYNEVDLLVHQGRTFGIVSQAEAIRCFPSMRADLQRLATAHYFAELMDSLVADGEEAKPAFMLLRNCLGWLDEGAPLELLSHYYELHLLELAGYRPQLYHCPQCQEWLREEPNYLEPAAGGFLCPRCASERPQAMVASVGAQKVLRFLQRSAPPQSFGLVLRPALRAELERLMAAYVCHILERVPRASQFLAEVRALTETRLSS